MMWPDCSPPSTRSCSSHRGDHVRSPTGVSTISMPAAASARRSPRFDITVTATARFRSRSRASRSSASISHDLVAVDELAVLVDREHAVGVAVERETERRRRARRTAVCKRLRDGSSRSRSLMFRPSGSACSTSTSAPSVRNARGPTSDAAPFAQSSTTCSPSRVRPSSAATRCSTYSSSADRGRHPRRRASCGSGSATRAARSSASIAASASSGSLRPPAAEDLHAVVGPRVVAGRDDGRRGSRRAAATNATAGVGRTPSGTTCDALGPSPRSERRSRCAGRTPACRGR